MSNTNSTSKTGELTSEELKLLVRYDEVEKQFFWLSEKRVGFKKSVIAHSAGDSAGCQRSDGRWVMRINGKLHLRYRLVWLYMHGVWPSGEIDHINGDLTDDRLENLRDTSRRVNQENIRKAFKNKKSCDLLGVHSNPRNATSPWRASISTNGRQKYIGVFRTKEDAHAAYILAKRQMHEGCTL